MLGDKLVEHGGVAIQSLARSVFGGCWPSRGSTGRRDRRKRLVLRSGELAESLFSDRAILGGNHGWLLMISRNSPACCSTYRQPTSITLKIFPDLLAM
jgi:hypothetical protein